MKNKVVSLEKAMECINDGVTLMVGGFLNCGSPIQIIDAIVAKGVKDITLIANDTSTTGIANSKLIASRMVKKAIVSHIGTNPETGRQMLAGELDVQLVPQGTLAERIRAAGAGLGGVLTPAGVGTDVSQGEATMTVEGKEYTVALPLKADVAIIKGSVVDTFGNIMYNGTTRNFNPLMATAADVVIVEAEKIVEVGELDPSHVVTSGIFVDYIVGGANNGE